MGQYHSLIVEADLLAFVTGSTCKILNIYAFEIKVRKQNYLLLFELTQILRHYHIGMR